MWLLIHAGIKVKSGHSSVHPQILIRNTPIVKTNDNMDTLVRYVLRCLNIAVTSHERRGVSNHRQLDCLFGCLFRLTSKKNIKARRCYPVTPHKGERLRVINIFNFTLCIFLEYVCTYRCVCVSICMYIPVLCITFDIELYRWVCGYVPCFPSHLNNSTISLFLCSP